MRKLFALPLIALLGLGACTDPYGRVDPLSTGLLGAGIGAAAGFGIAALSQPRHSGYGGYRSAPAYYAAGPGYGGYGGGYGRRW